MHFISSNCGQLSSLHQFATKPSSGKNHFHSSFKTINQNQISLKSNREMVPLKNILNLFSSNIFWDTVHIKICVSVLQLVSFFKLNSACARSQAQGGQSTKKPRKFSNFNVQSGKSRWYYLILEIPGGANAPLPPHLRRRCLGNKKQDTVKSWPLVKNPHFLSYLHETWCEW